MQASVIISYYKNIPNLSLLLQALNQQTVDGFEVIISEDDDSPQTTGFIQSIKNTFNFPIKLISQPDEGFRKCMALNNSIKASSSAFLIFIDGDCIPHKKMVYQYLKEKKPGLVLYGRRVVLGKSFSSKLLLSNSIKAIRFINLIFSRTKRLEDAIYFPFLQQFIKPKKANRLLGCNMGLNKNDLLAINGFDEDYTFAGGGEDSDIEWRLMKVEGVDFLSMRFKAIVYHIYHEERFTNKKQTESTTFMNRKIQAGFYFCKNGLTKMQ